MTPASIDLSPDGSRVTVHIPMKIRHRRGRRAIIMPTTPEIPDRTLTQPDRPLVKAVARAHRWKRRLETGEFASVTELAAAEKINQSYLCRVLRLTLLAPDIVEAILDGRQSASLMLNALLKPFPVSWSGQRTHFAVNE